MCADEKRQTLSEVSHALKKFPGIRILGSGVTWGKPNKLWDFPVTKFSLLIHIDNKPPTYEEWQSLYKIMHIIDSHFGSDNKNVYLKVICELKTRNLAFELNVKNVDPDAMAYLFSLPWSDSD